LNAPATVDNVLLAAITVVTPATTTAREEGGEEERKAMECQKAAKKVHHGPVFTYTW